MGRIVISTNTTLDGVSQDPTGEEGFALGGWFLQITDADRAVWADAVHQEALAADALLLGGRTYAWFAPRWVDREGEKADRLRELPKYVVRSREGRTDWGPTTVLEDDVATSVAKLKANVDGDLLVYASYELIPTLLEKDLVDEVRVYVFPQVLGSGGRLFHQLTQAVALHLTEVDRIGDQLVRLSYDVTSSGR